MDTISRMFPILSDFLTNCHNSTIKLHLMKDKICEKPTKSNTFIIFGDSAETSFINATSLLFQAAVSYASEGLMVTYIAQKPLCNLPPQVHGLPQATASVLCNINFMYLKTRRELIGYLSTIDQNSLQPDIIVVDSMHMYLSQGSEMDQIFYKLIALVHNALTAASQEKRVLLMSLQQSYSTDLSTCLQLLDCDVAIMHGDNSKDAYMIRVVASNSDVWIRYRISNNVIYLVSVESVNPD